MASASALSVLLRWQAHPLLLSLLLSPRWKRRSPQRSLPQEREVYAMRPAGLMSTALGTSAGSAESAKSWFTSVQALVWSTTARVATTAKVLVWRWKCRCTVLAHGRTMQGQTTVTSIMKSRVTRRCVMLP